MNWIRDLRLFFYFKGQLLKVRRAQDSEPFTNPCRFGNIEFEITPSQDYVMIWTTFLADLTPEEARDLVELVGARYPFSARYEELKEVCPDVVFKDGDEWIFFGGSFNPWHPGHQACLNLAPKEVTTFVIPDRSPHKDLRDIEPVSTLLHLSSKIRFKKNQYLVPTFLLTPKKNPTVEWMEKLRSDLPEKKLALLVGFDSFQNILSWTRANDLLNTLNTIYVVSRMETDLVRKTIAASVRNVAPKIEIVFLGHHDFETISSTEIRNNPNK